MASSSLDETTLPFASVKDLAAALRAKQLSAKELAKFFLKRLTTFGPKYNAVACVLEKRAHQAVGDIDYDLKHDRFRSPLQGIPYGAKDLLAVAGQPTTWGAKPFADRVFDYNASVIDRLDGHNAVLLAKLSMIELAGGGGYSSASASLQGPCRNPWNTQYWAGGSSSGSGAAVAAGLVPFALGSETSGSILVPAAYCGLSGLRPTYGSVSRHGAMALSWTLDKIGVLAHTAEDCGIVLGEIAHSDDLDPGSAHKSFYYTPKYYRELRLLKVAVAEIDWTDYPDEPLRPAFTEAFRVLKSLGAPLVESKLPSFPYGLVIGTIIDSEGASIFEDFIRSGTVDQLADAAQIEGLKAALQYSATDYLKAMRIRRQIVTDFEKMFAEVDLIAAPTVLSVTDRVDQPFDETEPKRPAQKGFADDLIQAGNLAGLPAITIPCGVVNGLPIGLQIVGPPFQENRILALARAFQERTNFHQQHPTV